MEEDKKHYQREFPQRIVDERLLIFESIYCTGVSVRVRHVQVKCVFKLVPTPTWASSITCYSAYWPEIEVTDHLSVSGTVLLNPVAMNVYELLRKLRIFPMKLSRSYYSSRNGDLIYYKIRMIRKLSQLNRLRFLISLRENIPLPTWRHINSSSVQIHTVPMVHYSYHSTWIVPFGLDLNFHETGCGSSNLS